MSKKSLFIILASCLSIISVFLEWGRISLGKEGFYGFNGIDSNQGKIILVLSIIIGIIAFLSCYLKNQSKIFNIVVLIFSVANFVILLMSMLTLKDNVVLVNQLKSLGVSASLGIGLILSILSSLIIFGLNLLEIFSQDETKKAQNIEFSHNKISEKCLPILIPLC